MLPGQSFRFALDLVGQQQRQRQFAMELEEHIHLRHHQKYHAFLRPLEDQREE